MVLSVLYVPSWLDGSTHVVRAMGMDVAGLLKLEVNSITRFERDRGTDPTSNRTPRTSKQVLNLRTTTLQKCEAVPRRARM